jgi:hypothetical protein
MTRLIGLLAICAFISAGAVLLRLVGFALDAALYGSAMLVIVAIHIYWRRVGR